MNPRKLIAPLLLFAVLALHVALTLYNMPLKVAFSGEPVTSFDYDTHYEQTVRVIEALEGWGKSWCWDPHLNAGFPNGTIFDADNKAHELLTYALFKLGVSMPVGYNLFILIGHLLAPFLLYFACRLMRGGQAASIIAAFLGSMVWNFDSMTRWAWWVGMISYGMAATLAPLAFALFYRYVTDRKWWCLAVLAVVLPVAHLVHPYTFMILVIPVGVLYVMVIKKLRPIDHALIMGVAAVTVLANLYWLLVAFQFFKYVTRSDIYGLVHAWALLTDYLGLISNTENQALVGMRTGWRFAIWALAVFGMVLWRRDRDDRFRPFAFGLGFMFVISYLGKYIPGVTMIQPYRHVIPLAFFAIIPAAIYLPRAVRDITREKLRPAVRNIMIVLAVVALPHLVRDAIFFIPQLKPVIERPEAGLPNITDTLGFGSIGWPDQQQYRHGLPRIDYRALRRWVLEHDDGSGRFLVYWWTVGEYLAWSTNAQVMGGFRLINLKHGQANLFRKYYYKPPPSDYLRKYIKTYAIKYLIVTGPRRPIEERKDVIKGFDFIAPAHRIYITDENPSFFMKGGGKVKASVNKIEVTDASGDEIILKYHFLDTFECSPGCRVERHPLDNDEVGFVKVANPPKDFVIENAY